MDFIVLFIEFNCPSGRKQTPGLLCHVVQPRWTDADWSVLVTSSKHYRFSTEFQRLQLSRGILDISLEEKKKEKRRKRNQFSSSQPLLLLLCRHGVNVGFLLAGSRPFPRHHCGCQITSKDNVIWFWREDLIKSAQLNEGL